MDLRVLFVVVGGIGTAASLQGGVGEENAARRANDFRYTPDPRVMRVLAGGHKSALADALWLSALPDMSRPFGDPALKKRWIAGATEVITDLDPAFERVYGWGADHLSLVDKNPDAAIALLTKGVERNPQSAGLHVALAMAYYEYRKDKDKAIEYLEKASTLPGIDSLSLAMLASMQVKGRDDFMALAVWAKQLEDARNPKVRSLCEYELWRTKEMIAGRAAREFAAQHGRPPAAPSDLRDPKLMSESVFDVVLEGLSLDEKGRPHYARIDELERAAAIVRADGHTAGLANYLGRTPTAEEFFVSFGPMPDPGPGKRWVYEDGKLSLADDVPAPPKR